MAEEPQSLALMADFTVDILRGYLIGDDSQPNVEVHAAPYGPIVPLLDQFVASDTSHDPGFVLVWTQPELVSTAFRNVLDHQPYSINEILHDVDRFGERLTELSRRAKFVLVPTWAAPSAGRGYGMLEMSVGVAHALAQMNLRLANNLAGAPSVALLDTSRWLQRVGERAHNPKLWYAAKVPFGHAVFRHATADIKAAMRGVLGLNKKLIVLDLDQTLWGGVVGEVDWTHLRLGGHDAVGEAFVDFQRVLKSLARRGLLLAVVSKNTESLALESINNHPEMVLKLNDFAAWRINWKDKAQNVVDLVEELNLGLSSVVFIDDDPVERDRVRAALPAVYVPDWPQSPLLYRQQLLNLTVFDTPFIGADDRKRAETYVEQRKRTHSKEKFQSANEWLQTLGTKVTVESLVEENLPRVAQLINKTNQMNLKTRRLSAAELQEWVLPSHRMLWTFRVEDRFGDSGICGILSLEAVEGCAHVVDFVLSCRVIGRKVEETMLHIAVESAKEQGLERVQVEYIPTDRNQPCLEFWAKSGLDRHKTKPLFAWLTSADYPKPDVVTLVCRVQ